MDSLQGINNDISLFLIQSVGKECKIDLLLSIFLVNITSSSKCRKVAQVEVLVDKV